MPHRPPLDVRGYIANLGPEKPLETPEGAEGATWGVSAQAFLWGAGEAECSSCTELVPSPQVIFDVNGYYRELGFPFPYLGITRKQLRLAYLAHDGESSIRLTYIMGQLLNSVTRREYDLTRLGDLYMDRYVQDWFARQAHVEARRRTFDDGVKSTKDQVLDDWGLKGEPDGEPGMDSVGEVVQDSSDPTDEGSFVPWSWSYYLWSSRSTNTDALGRWQGKLIHELNSRGERIRFCVGFSGRRTPARWTTGVIGRHRVVFLREDVEPTDELAALAVSALLREHDDEEGKAEPSMANKPTFSRGAAQAEKAAKEQSNFSRPTKYWGIKEDKGTSVLRFIDDGDPETGWIFIPQHGGVQTKGPDPDMADDKKKSWPKRMGAVCRRAPAFKGFFDDCYICDNLRKDNGKQHFPTIRLWARAVVRKPIVGTEDHVALGQCKPYEIGTVIGYVDDMVTEDEFKDGKPTGKQITHKNVVAVNMGMKNFFGALQGYYDVNGTVLDRDFYITRKGMDTDTDYTIIARDPIRNEDGTVFDLRDPAIKAQYEGIIDLEEMIMQQASDDHYHRFFDPRYPIPSRDNDDDSAPASAQPARSSASTPATPAADEPNEEQIRAMRDRIKGIKAENGSEAAVPARNFG